MVALDLSILRKLFLQLFFAREWMRSRTLDNQEGWKEGSEERGGPKSCWADGVDPRAPSPGIMGYNKSAASQDYQVKHIWSPKSGVQ